MIWNAITGNLWRVGCAALLAVVAGLSIHIWGLPLIGGGLEARLKATDRTLEQTTRSLYTCRFDLDDMAAASARQSSAVHELARRRDESTRRAAEALRAAQAENVKADEAIGRIRARKVQGCETGPEIMGADL